MYSFTKNLAVLLVGAASFHAAGQERYTRSADGGEVTDSKTGLI